MFETGVSNYIVGVAEVFNNFPVDCKGNPHIACVHCRFNKFSQPKCLLNGEICDFPEKYRGDRCPLIFEGDDQ